MAALDPGESDAAKVIPFFATPISPRSSLCMMRRQTGEITEFVVVSVFGERCD
jgi:hypothetical protein